MTKKIADQIREIATFHGDDGTSGFLLDEDHFAKIFALIGEERKEIVDKIKNVEKSTGFYNDSLSVIIKQKDYDNLINNLDKDK